MERSRLSGLLLLTEENFRRINQVIYLVSTVNYIFPGIGKMFEKIWHHTHTTFFLATVLMVGSNPEIFFKFRTFDLYFFYSYQCFEQFCDRTLHWNVILQGRFFTLPRVGTEEISGKKNHPFSILVLPFQTLALNEAPR